ncbi:hypothetical protein HMPREF9709_00425 [Helcococcus kunzii ATCC 51366]|uniref:Uncharacterized protein n=1 Tax=Helcococcus kunzii ATCC 51366 TaxID=883114 RepID=H3NM64_9FIRM|nr:DUF5702 domain-containing protein [Helcococcus kunzii]EHR35473.1 hypothetical protein HMPREF9709_00425 [Helcococcus kunzii ATCC 51366]
MIKSSKGTISVFLALILLPIYSFALVSMDIAKIFVANNHLNMANEIASYSVESSFNDKLYEKYGIFGIDKDKEFINQYVNYLLKENIEKEESDIYHAMVDDSNVNIENSDLLIANDNLESQILEYMKLVGPYKITNGVLNLFNISMSSRQYTEILNNKMDYEEEYSKAVKSIDNLVNNFILYDNNFSNINNDVSNLNTNLENLRKNTKDIKTKFSKIETKTLDKDMDINKINEKSKMLLDKKHEDIIIKIYKLTNTDKKHTENNEFIELIKKNKDFLEEIYTYSKLWNIDDKLIVDDKDFDISIALDKIVKYNSEIVKTYDKQISIAISEYNSNNNSLKEKLKTFEITYKNIISELENFSNSSVELQEKLDKWGESIKSMEQSDIKNNFNSEYKSTKISFTKENIDKLLEKLKNNEKTLHDINEELDRNTDIFKIDPLKYNSDNDKKFNLNNLGKLPSLNNFKIYKFAMERNKSDTIEHSQKKVAKENKKNIEKFSEKAKKDSIEKSKGSIYDYIDKENIDKISEISNEKSPLFDNNTDIKNYKKIINFSSEIIPSNDTNIIDNLYLSQYIIDKFYNKLSKNEEFGSQIEYILFGKDDLSKNNNTVNNYIFGLRFLLNSLYAFTNTNLKLEANAIAISIAGWTGFAVPLIRTLVLSAMSFGESVIDLETINDDKAIETFKNKASWKVSVTSLPSILGKKAKEIVDTGLDNIYDSIINYSNEGIDVLEKNVDEFTHQTIDGISQSIISEIVSPVQNVMFNNINQEGANLKQEIEETLNEVNSNIQNEKGELYSIKSNMFNFVKENIMSNIDNFKQINLEEYFGKLSKNIEDKVKGVTSKYSNILKDKINSSISKNKIKQKELFNKYVDDYLDKLGLNKKITNMGSTSGLSFKYKDYLTLVTLFRLMSGNKSKIMERLAIVIDYEMKKEFSEFDITKVFVSFTIDSKLRINTVLLNKYIFKDSVENTIIGGY